MVNAAVVNEQLRAPGFRVLRGTASAPDTAWTNAHCYTKAYTVALATYLGRLVKFI